MDSYIFDEYSFALCVLPELRKRAMALDPPPKTRFVEMPAMMDAATVVGVVFETEKFMPVRMKVNKLHRDGGEYPAGEILEGYPRTETIEQDFPDCVVSFVRMMDLNEMMNAQEA